MLFPTKKSNSLRFLTFLVRDFAALNLLQVALDWRNAMKTGLPRQFATIRLGSSLKMQCSSRRRKAIPYDFRLFLYGISLRSTYFMQLEPIATSRQFVKIRRGLTKNAMLFPTKKSNSLRFPTFLVRDFTTLNLLYAVGANSDIPTICENSSGAH